MTYTPWPLSDEQDAVIDLCRTFAREQIRPATPEEIAAAEDGTFRSRDELEAIYRDEVGLTPGEDVIAYCRIGERSGHTWFALSRLLGWQVRNYDGSWAEYGNAIGVPIDCPG